MSRRRLRLTLGRDGAGLRLDQGLARALGEQLGIELSRRRARDLIAAGEVRLDGKPVRIASRPLAAGALLEVALELPEPGPSPRVLYEDADLLALDKPAGLPVQATATGSRVDAGVDGGDDLFTQARRYVAAAEGYVALHHRLDRGTSGVVLFAKSRRANAPLAAAFRQLWVDKRYRVLVAVSAPPPETWSVVDRLAKVAGGGKPRMERVEVGGQEAVTDFRLLEHWQTAAEVEARPKTGRMHQIRIHLASSGLPVLGDRLYGVAELGRLAPARPMLHAASLELEHPVTSEPLLIESPLPEDYEQMRRALAE